MSARRPFPLVLACVLLLVSCRRAGISTYQIAKEKDPELPPAAASAAPAPGAMASTPVATANGPALAWTAPNHWKTKAASAMRKGSYTVPGEGGLDADLSITSFGGDVGGELANLNRWRGQLQLAPVGETELSSAVTRLEFNGLKFGFVELAGAGASAQRTLGAWAAHGGATWFFKLSGPDAVVAREKNAFLAFLGTVKPGAGSTP